MGWTFACNRSHDRQACIEELRMPSRFGDRQRLIKSSVVGRCHWYVAEFTEGPNAGKRYIGLDLMQSGYPDHGWGYKDMTESMGPNEVSCPIGFLALVPEPPEPYGPAWRERVKAYHAKKRERKANPPKPGDRVEYGGHHYTLIRQIGRKGWFVDLDGSAANYRMSCRQLAQAKRLEPAA